MLRIFIFFFSLLLSIAMSAQDDATLPYASIGEYPTSSSAGNMVARMCDGLGFRYYWATERLTEKDLTYRPTPEARSTYETLEHLYGLADVVRNVAKGEPSVRPLVLTGEDYTSLRLKTLEALKEASQYFSKLSEEEIAERKVAFASGDKLRESEFWHLLNGPLADAIYHVGQVVTLRRITGNPIPSGVNVFMGTRKEP